MFSSDLERFYTTRSVLYQGLICVVGHERRMRTFFRTQNVLRPGMRVLDVGCGSGAVTKALLKVADEQGIQHITCFGFDITQKLLDAFQRWIDIHPAEQVFLMKANVLNISSELPEEWRSFDLVMSSGMFEYLPMEQIRRVLQELRSCARADAKLYLFLSRDAWFNRLFLKGFWKARLYTREEIVELFTHSGWRVVSIEPFASWGYVVRAKVGGLQAIFVSEID